MDLEQRVDMAHEIGIGSTGMPTLLGSFTSNPSLWPTCERYAAVRKLNMNQMKLVDYVTHHAKTNRIRLDLFLTGGAGTGKTLVTNTLVQSMRHY